MVAIKDSRINSCAETCLHESNQVSSLDVSKVLDVPQRWRRRISPPWVSPLASILPIGAERRRGKISRMGGRRPSRVTRSALAGDLARLHTGAPGGWPALSARTPGADRAALSPYGGTRGRLARRRRRGPEGLRAARGAQRSPSEGPPVIGGSCAASRSAHPARGACQDRRPAWARRAPRALELLVEKVVTSQALTRAWQGRSHRSARSAHDNAVGLPADPLTRPKSGSRIMRSLCCAVPQDARIYEAIREARRACCAHRLNPPRPRIK